MNTGKTMNAAENPLKEISMTGFDIQIELDPENFLWHWNFYYSLMKKHVLHFEVHKCRFVTHIDVDFSGMKNRQKIQDLFAPLFRKVGEIEIDQFLDSAAGILKQIEW